MLRLEGAEDMVASQSRTASSYNQVPSWFPDPLTRSHARPEWRTLARAHRLRTIWPMPKRISPISHIVCSALVAAAMSLAASGTLRAQQVVSSPSPKYSSDGVMIGLPRPWFGLRSEPGSSADDLGGCSVVRSDGKSYIKFGTPFFNPFVGVSFGLRLDSDMEEKFAKNLEVKIMIPGQKPASYAAFEASRDYSSMQIAIPLSDVRLFKGASATFTSSRSKALTVSLDGSEVALDRFLACLYDHGPGSKR